MFRSPLLLSAALALLTALGAACVTEVSGDDVASGDAATAPDAGGARDALSSPDAGGADSGRDAAVTDQAPADGATHADATAAADAGSPLPVQLAPCSDGECWDTSAAPQPCQAISVDEDFSTGLYNVHAYATLLHAATPTRVHLARTGGAWQPALIATTADGEVLSDGRTGLQRDDVDVRVEQSGESGAEAAIEIIVRAATAATVYVTGWEVVQSGFAADLPADATYTLQVASQCQGVTVLPCVVNGHQVDEPACGWLHHVGWQVVPRLAGSRDERLTAASRVAWWSLKEGVMFLQNPIVYSNCNTTSGDQRIGPLEVCAQGRAWQVGLSAIQVWAATLPEAQATAAALYPGLSADQVLAATAAEALLDADTSAQVVSSTGDLRLSWLLRNSAVGFTHQVGPVTRECIDASLSWCYGTGWTATRLFAPDRAGALQSIADLRALFDQIAP